MIITNNNEEEMDIFPLNLLKQKISLLIEYIINKPTRDLEYLELIIKGELHERDNVSKKLR